MKLPLGKQILWLRSKVKRKIEQLTLKKENSHFFLMLDRYKKLPASKKNLNSFDAIMQNEIAYSRWHISKNEQFLKKYSLVPLEDAILLEIGTGERMTASIGLSLCGVKKIITVDKYRLANPELIERTCESCVKHAKKLGLKQKPNLEQKITNENLNEILLKNFNIDYCAPYDTNHMDLLDNSIDSVIANTVFEHVNYDDLQFMAREIFRVLKNGGIFFTDIDFKDHISYIKDVSIYDYLQFSNKEWQELELNKIEEYVYHQNRLRTKDYLKIFQDAGFEVVYIKQFAITTADRKAFAQINVHEEFKQKYTDEELMEKGVDIVLRKPINQSLTENQSAPSGN